MVRIALTGTNGVIMRLEWRTDPNTTSVARNYPLPLRRRKPTSQYAGHKIRASNWRRRILNPDEFHSDIITCSPFEIIKHFKAEQYLAGLALVVSWGGMARTSPYIYGRHSLRDIRDALKKCRQSIRSTRRIDDAWRVLTQDLDWSAVISSKTLHFVCRSLGYNANPPVAIDNAVILRKVWPAFKQCLPVNLRPQCWSGKEFDNYNRYMTAVLEWARVRGWTTTEVETTLFDKYTRKGDDSN